MMFAMLTDETQVMERAAGHAPVVEAALSEGASGEGCGRDVAVMALILTAGAALLWMLL